jgi:hypothetical protein
MVANIVPSMTPKDALERCLSNGSSRSLLNPLTFFPARSSSLILDVNSEQSEANELNSGNAMTSTGFSQGVNLGIIFSAILKNPVLLGG